MSAVEIPIRCAITDDQLALQYDDPRMVRERGSWRLHLMADEEATFVVEDFVGADGEPYQVSVRSSRDDGSWVPWTRTANVVTAPPLAEPATLVIEIIAAPPTATAKKTTSQTILTREGRPDPFAGA